MNVHGLANTRTQVNRLRLRGVDSADLQKPFYAQRMLANADIYPTIPPSAILLVRKVHDPAPGTLGHHASAVRPDHAWEQALQAELAWHYHHACRPLNGRVDSGATAVVFEDESEMLACFCLACLDVSIRDTWWWLLLCKSMGFSGVETGSIAGILRENIRVVPAVIWRLSTWGAIQNLLRRLEVDEAEFLIRALAEHFELAAFVDALTQDLDSVLLAGSNEPTDTYRASSAIPPGPAAETRRVNNDMAENIQRMLVQATPPWQHWFTNPAMPLSWAPQHRVLVALGLVLQTKPQWIRPRARQKAFAVWFRFQRQQAISQEPAPDVGPTAPIVKVPVSGQSLKAVDADLQTKRPQQKKSGSEPHAETTAIKYDIASVESENADISVTADRIHIPWTEPVSTSLGGVLYLINLFQQMDMPKCFLPHWRLYQQLGPWTLLAWVSRQLLGSGLDDYRDDSIWPMLAGMDDDETYVSKIGAFKGDDACYLPHAWDQQVRQSDEQLFWHIEDGLLWVYTAQSYVLAVVDLKGQKPEHGQNEIRKRFDLHSEPADGMDSLRYPMLKEGSQDLLRWGSVVLPFFQGYLRHIHQATRTDPGHDPVQALFRCPAEIRVTATHVDMVARIDSISIAARWAGLDRDPGWLVDYGRVINFHFE